VREWDWWVLCYGSWCCIVVVRDGFSGSPFELGILGSMNVSPWITGKGEGRGGRGLYRGSRDRRFDVQGCGSEDLVERVLSFPGWISRGGLQDVEQVSELDMLD
jgi:hypothetical protein